MTTRTGTPADAARAEIRLLRAYDLPADERPDLKAKLDFNESPFDVPEDLKWEVMDRLAKRNWGHYPEFGAVRLRQAIAAFAGVRPEEVVLGNGSGEVILAAVSVFAGGGRLVLATPTFSLYGQIAAIAGAAIEAVPRRGPDFDVDADGLLRAAGAGAVPLVCSPNNPTGGVVPLEFVRRLAAAAPVILLDQAYADFAEDGDGAAPLLREIPNLIVFRTLSKAFSAAGFRIGYALAQEPVARELRKAVLPFNVGLGAEELALAVLERPETARRTVETIVAERERVASALRAAGALVPPSRGNFLFVAPPGDAAACRAALLERGVLVRDMTSAAPNRLRITIGSPAENDALLAAWKEVP